MKFSFYLFILYFPFNTFAVDWEDIGFRSGVLTMCSQLPYEFSTEQQSKLISLSDALFFASEKNVNSKQYFIEGTMNFFGSLERSEKAIFKDSMDAVMVTITKKVCLDSIVSADSLLLLIDNK
jgi:hypothetical protein|tara:strand:+ start:1114 stop:1482 length:369 start_codon:yes stop_codon:yes gene_type:complete